MTSNPKVAIIHDWLVVDGGAEKVLRSLIDLYPEAKVYSLIDHLNKVDRANILNGKKSNTSIIQKFPFSKQLYRKYLPWMPYAIEQLDLREFDLVISSSYAVSKGVLTNKNQVHVCYCHSPMRYIWDLYLNYVPKVKWYNFFYTIPMRSILSKLRIWDVIASNRVDYFIANSKNVAERISKIYRRESKVIYPPVDLVGFDLQVQKDDYFVTASRLVPYKKVDMIIEAFRKLPTEKLMIMGNGPELSRLKNLSKSLPNITILGHVDRSKYKEVLGKAKGFIIASHEDFGIAPLEAQACGTPVIGYGVGGVLESTQVGKTAVHFNEQNSKAISTAIEELKNAQLLSADEIRSFSLSFGNDRFKKEIKDYIDSCL